MERGMGGRERGVFIYRGDRRRRRRRRIFTNDSGLNHKDWNWGSLASEGQIALVLVVCMAK
jgi:hypothetical protein